jgi:tripartite-type tricarboxylate transporter receptor subunit TctC
MRAITRLARAALATAITVLGSHTPAQVNYPERPIRIIVGVPAGQSTDIIARLLASRAGEILKQSIVVDNRPGAGGIISHEAAKAAPPDGYTLLIVQKASVRSGRRLRAGRRTDIGATFSVHIDINTGSQC